MNRINPNSLFLGKKNRYLPTCQSTNDIVSQELAAIPPAPEGFLAWTGEQTAGRGQRGNSWEAAPGQNLTFSLLLKPQFLKASEQFLLSMAVSLGLRDMLRQHLPATAEIKVKWPNDLFADGEKIAGILIESQLRGTMLGEAIVGIGLNVNQRHFAHPNALSMHTVSGHVFELPALLERLMVDLEQRYLQLKSHQYTQLRQSYHQCLYAHEQWRVFEDLRKPSPALFNGKIRGVDPLGRLCIEEQAGNVEAFSMKEVGFVH